MHFFRLLSMLFYLDLKLSKKNIRLLIDVAYSKSEIQNVSN